MNAARRKAIDKLYMQLEDLKAAIESLQEEEQEAFDNLPESLQDTERGEAMQEAVDNLEAAASSIEEAMDSLSEASN